MDTNLNLKAVKNPINPDYQVKRIESIPVKDIVKRYEKSLQIDVRKYFGSNEFIHIYECVNSTYQFYYPFDCYGDGFFYQQLQQKDFYYKNDKWEYDKVLRIIDPNTKVLEIGCGEGAFLQKLKEKSSDALGLELNEECVLVGEKRGLKITNELLEEHAKKNKGVYDVVVGFQILEHISDPLSFLEHCISCLKTNGILIMAVPNNNAAFFKYRKPLRQRRDQQERTLLKNMPPHHMGLWGKKSLKYVGLTLGLQPVCFYSERLNNERFGLWSEIIINRYIGFLSDIFYSVLVKVLHFAVKSTDGKLVLGDTIIGVFKKKQD